MKRLTGLLAVAASLAATGAFGITDAELEKGFFDPPASARPHTWWHWMNGNVTKEGITADLEAMAQIGLGGAQIFDAGCDVPPGPVVFNSPLWFETIRHAVSEAKRLGLEIVHPNCSGWSSSGGPWIAPSNAMKSVVFSKAEVRGPKRFSAKLAQPHTPRDYYRDFRVVAFRIPAAEVADREKVPCRITTPQTDDPKELAKLTDGNLNTYVEMQRKESDKHVFTVEYGRSVEAACVAYQLDGGDNWGEVAEMEVEVSADGKQWRGMGRRPGGGWLQLGGSNTYAGATTVRNGNYTGLALWREESASTLSAGYYVTNAPIRLVADGRRTGRADLMYDLPPINYHITAGKSFELGATHSETNVVEDLTVRGGMDARIASLKKTGDGELSLLANFDITGRTEIVAGTVRLAPANTYSAAPGLWEGIFETNETVTAEFLAKFKSGEWKTDDIPIKKQYNDTTLVLSNRIVSSVYLFGRKRSPYWHYMMAPVYHGYIWNRTSEPVKVTLVGSIIDAWSIWARGSKVASLYDSSQLAKGTATLQPGPNAIMVRGWVRNNDYAGWMVPSKMPNWAPYMGFAMAYGTTDTEYNASDYFVPTNGAAACAGGDGFMFTRDARAPEDFTAEELATTRTTITDLAMHPGAYLDLAGSPLFIKTLEGSGSITNGDLTVKERWTLGLSNISASPLYLDGALAFGEGAVVEFNGEGARLSHDQAVEKPIVNALGGISGSPAFASQPNWKLKLSGDGKSLIAVYYPVGTKFILR